jgi:hypothetical protein
MENGQMLIIISFALGLVVDVSTVKNIMAQFLLWEVMTIVVRTKKESFNALSVHLTPDYSPNSHYSYEKAKG